MNMFDIQDKKFNKTISVVEPNLLSALVIGEEIVGELHSNNMEQELIPNGLWKNIEDRMGFDVIEIYPAVLSEKEPVVITKIEAVYLAKYFGIID